MLQEILTFIRPSYAQGFKPCILPYDGGFCVMKNKGKIGYKYKALKVNGKRIDEHRFIAIQHWGEDAVKGMDVHHINGDTLDNRIENLTLIPRKDHARHHALGHITSASQRRKESKSVRSYYKTHLHACAKAVLMMTTEKIPIAIFDSATTTEEYGFCSVPVSKACRGELKTYRNFTWRFVDEEEEIKVPILRKNPKRTPQ